MSPCLTFAVVAPDQLGPDIKAAETVRELQSWGWEFNNCLHRSHVVDEALRGARAFFRVNDPRAIVALTHDDFIDGWRIDEVKGLGNRRLTSAEFHRTMASFIAAGFPMLSDGCSGGRWRHRRLGFYYEVPVLQPSNLNCRTPSLSSKQIASLDEAVYDIRSWFVASSRDLRGSFLGGFLLGALSNLDDASESENLSGLIWSCNQARLLVRTSVAKTTPNDTYISRKLDRLVGTLVRAQHKIRPYRDEADEAWDARREHTFGGWVAEDTFHGRYWFVGDVPDQLMKAMTWGGFDTVPDEKMLCSRAEERHRLSTQPYTEEQARSIDETYIFPSANENAWSVGESISILDAALAKWEQKSLIALFYGSLVELRSAFYPVEMSLRALEERLTMMNLTMETRDFIAATVNGVRQRLAIKADELRRPDDV